MLALALCLLLGQDPDVDALLKQLAHESVEVREKATAALVAMGDKAEERLRKELAAAPAELKARYESILASIGRNRRLRAVLPPLKPVTLAAKDKALPEVVEEFRRQSGMRVHLDSASDVRVTVEVKDATPFEALLALCRAGKLSFEPEIVQMKQGHDLDKEPTIWLSLEGYRDVPRLAGRHYLIEAQSVETHRQTQGDRTIKTTQLTVCARWLPDIKPDIVAVDVTYVKDDRGQPLFKLDRNAPRMSEYVTHKADSRTRSQLHRIPLLNPSKEARTLAFIKGTVTAKYAVGDQKLVFDAPAESVGKSRESSRLVVILREFKAGPGECRIVLATAFPGPDLAEGIGAPPPLDRGQVRLKLEDGSTREADSASNKEGGLVLNFDRLPSKVAAVEVVVGPLYHEDKFDFELKDVPLPK